MVLLNRNNPSERTPHLLIVGDAGSGKTRIVQEDIKEVLQSTNDDVIVVDTFGEYLQIGKQYDASIIDISPNSSIHINPLDIVISTDTDNFITEMQLNMIPDFIMSLCGTLFCDDAFGGYELSAKQKTLIARATATMLKLHRVHRENPNIPMPTLTDFYKELLLQLKNEDSHMATTLELGINQAFNQFASDSNLKCNNRFMIYDISCMRNIGNAKYLFSMLVILKQVMNQIIQNYLQGKRTWVFIDNIDSLMKNYYSSSFLSQVWVRSRKLGALLTGIMQKCGVPFPVNSYRTVMNSHILVTKDCIPHEVTDSKEFDELISFDKLL